MRFTLKYNAINMSALCIIFALILGVAEGQTQPVNGSPAPSKGESALAGCTTEKHRQFDFWLGDWDAIDEHHASEPAHVRVTRILDGCVLHEEYSDNGGLRGES